LRSKHLVGLILVAVLIATFAPFSTQAYAQSSEEKRVEKFVEVAERASERVNNLIEFIYANETAMNAINATPGLYEELEGNRSLFETGMCALSNATDALSAGEFQLAIANATEALGIFREVFKALNDILAEAGVPRGQLIDAQGLIEAMKRAQDRIKRLEEIAPPEVLAILGSAERYLNVDTALTWLSQGRINETVWNLTQANRLISLAHSSLKKKAGELNVKRMGSYLKIIENLYNKTKRQVDKAVKRGLPGADALQTELLNMKTLIDEAKEAFTAGDYSGAITNIVNARNTLKEIEHELVELRRAF